MSPSTDGPVRHDVGTACVRRTSTVRSADPPGTGTGVCLRLTYWWPRGECRHDDAWRIQPSPVRKWGQVMKGRLIEVYATKRTKLALIVMPRDEGRLWLRRRGFPAFWDRHRGGYLISASAVVDLVVMARWEGWHVREYHASSPRQAALQRRHAVAARGQRARDGPSSSSPRSSRRRRSPTGDRPLRRSSAFGVGERGIPQDRFSTFRPGRSPQMNDPWSDAREQVRAAGLVARMEAEILGEDPGEARELDLLRGRLNSRHHMREALLLARSRDDSEALAEAQSLYAMADREARGATRQINDRWIGEGA